jgi:nitroreductase
MDAYFAVVSLRTVREYSDRPIPDDALSRILEAGRTSGSSQNKQPWRFYVVRRRETLNRMAEAVYAPDNLRGCQVAVAIVTSGKGGFDIGRCAQNMMLAAWSDGIGSAPNGIKDGEILRPLLGLEPDQAVVTVLSLGYPTKPIKTSGDIDGILGRIKRKPLDELALWVDG